MKKITNFNVLSNSGLMTQSLAEINVRMHVLVVDDDLEILEEISEFISRSGVFVSVARNVADAVAILDSVPGSGVTVVLTDLRMPGRGGLSLADYVRATFVGDMAIEVVAMTGHGTVELAVDALRAQVFDFITKPLHRPDILLAIKAGHDAAIVRRIKAAKELDAACLLRSLVVHGEAEARILEAQSAAVREVALGVLSGLVALRDAETGDHIIRTQAYAKLLVMHMRQTSRFADDLSSDELCDTIVKAVPLHDIGKVGIPDEVLLKPGPLTPEEFEVMKTHTTIGSRVIEVALKQVKDAGLVPVNGDNGLAFLEIARQIAESHHEKWNGSGYPWGLVGDDIPLTGRIMAIADVFDALLSERPYKKAMPIDQAIKLIADGRGVHFDPDIVDVFLAHSEEFARLSGSS